MALLDFLKKKEPPKASLAKGGEIEKAKKSEKKSEEISVKKTDKGAKRTLTPSESEEKKVSPSKIKSTRFSYEAIKQPHISEKASYLAEKGQYIFEISPNYNKNEIKKAVEGIYGVDVLSVNMIKIPAKKRRLGRTEGFRKAYKKAVVTIKEGQKIEIL